jgi:hypothetical protein
MVTLLKRDVIVIAIDDGSILVVGWWAAGMPGYFPVFVLRTSRIN